MFLPSPKIEYSLMACLPLEARRACWYRPTEELPSKKPMVHIPYGGYGRVGKVLLPPFHFVVHLVRKGGSTSQFGRFARVLLKVFQ